LRAGGNLPLPAVLRCRVRYFTDGVVLGSSAFLEEFFEKRRAFFGPQRKSGARRMRGADWGGVRIHRLPWDLAVLAAISNCCCPGQVVDSNHGDDSISE